MMLIVAVIALACWSELGFVVLRKFGRLVYWLIAAGGTATAVILLTEPVGNLPRDPLFVLACGGAIVLASAATTLATQIMETERHRALRIGIATSIGVVSYIVGLLIGGIIWFLVWQPHK